MISKSMKKGSPSAVFFHKKFHNKGTACSMQTRETLQLLFEKWIKKLRLTPDWDIHLE